VQQTVAADLYIAPASNEAVGLGAVIPGEALGWLRRQASVDAVETFRELRTIMQRNGSTEAILLAVVGGSRRTILTVGGSGSGALKIADLRGVAVSESFSRRHQVVVGEALTLLSPRGPVALPVAAIYRDYTRDEGVVLMNLQTFTKCWRDDGPQSVAVYVEKGADPASLGDSFDRQFSRAGEYHVYSNRLLRQRIIEIFDATFAVTQALRIVALIVAVAGIALSVTTLVVERRRETGILRALGCSPAQIRGLFATEATMICSVASIIGVAGGVALALILTWIVNPAFFGWTVGFSIPWLTTLTFPLWIMAAGFVAAWVPAGEAGKSSLAESVREE
jgi:putative ABC transport system permease protein